jgi:type IV secretory pathway TrbF-like protein
MVQLNNQLVGDLDSFGTAVNNCQTLTCVEQAYGTVSQELGSFVSSLESVDHAGVSQDLVDQMIAAAQTAQRATGSLADAGPSSTRFRSLNKQLNIVQVLTVLQNTQHRFVDAINGSPLG